LTCQTVARSAKAKGSEGGYFMHVYILQSIPFPDKFYVGITQDVNARLQEHNSGKGGHTSKYKPWRVKTDIAFSDEKKAIAFEKYLKSGSGRAFAKKRL